MEQKRFERLLDKIVAVLANEAKSKGFTDAKAFEYRVRRVVQDIVGDSVEIDFNPHAQAFPDIQIDDVGIEVKFTTGDTWRSVANSVLETNRIESVKKVYLVFGKMGGVPDVKWGDYEQSVVHVRTSHVPRFEVEIGAQNSLFEIMGVRYDDFRTSPMENKMEYIRNYARGRLKPGERLWWLDDNKNEHSLPIQARLYTSLSIDEKKRLRAEAALLCPGIVSSGRSRNKYDDVVLFLLTYHGVLCHQARDLFSAGSVANPKNDDSGGLYIQRSLKLIEPEMLIAAQEMDGGLFEEYWGKRVAPKQRIKTWLKFADEKAKGWKPSECLFIDL
ncbi:hypothetical protein NUT31_11970 [Aeromonas sp. BC14]|nr:hypothetical protein [Aeromonas sp. BC14]WAF93131.1 hypothetical protein NUT31_11970 [Aeromonas sp. BC14]